MCGVLRVNECHINYSYPKIIFSKLPIIIMTNNMNMPNIYMFIINVIFQTCFTSQPQVSRPMDNTNVIQKDA